MANQSMMLTQDQRLQMVLAPQLRQSLEMLQLPILELRTLVQQEIEKNPTLEEVPTETPTIEIEPGKSESDGEEKKELDFAEDFQVLAKLDDEWRSYFFQEEASRLYTPQDAEKRQYFLDSLPQQESLQEHMLRQLSLSGLSPADHQIGELIIGSINEDGYLTTTVESLSESAAMDAGHVSDILAVIQDFNPPGVAARDLRECLLNQLVRLGKEDTIANGIVTDHLEKLGHRRIQDIARSLRVSTEEIQKAADLIATLDPKPGRAYSTDVAAYVLPEVLVQKIEGKYVVILNDERLPHLRISSLYRRLMEADATSSDVKTYIMDGIRSGVFLIKSIQQRQQTIFKIATEIVRVQTEFLDQGLTHLKPLTMSQIADVVGVHETTVSRAVSGKYMQTPIGVFEMKYFFTPGLKTENGSDVSNKTVKDMISQMVDSEDPASPLSDQHIQNALNEKGIRIARRTVAKYRLVLHIPPSHMRKTY